MLARLRFRRHRERVYTWLIALAGILLAAGASWLAHDYSVRLADEGFRREVASRSAALDAAVAQHEQLVRSLAAFVATRETMTAADFHTYVATMRGGVEGVQALQWMPRLADADRARFEREGQADFKGFHVTEQIGQWILAEAEQRPVYFPVRYIEPVAGNEQSLGFDFAADPLMADAMERGLATADVVASERMVLLQEEGVHYGVAMLMPVLAADGSVRGHVAGVFRVGDLLQAAIARLPPVGLHISVTDASGPGPERTLHVFSDRLSNVADLLTVPFEAQDEGPAAVLLASYDLHVADRIWRVYFEPGPGYYAPVPPVPAWLAAVLVLLVTVLLTTLLVLMQKRSQLLARATLSDGLTGLPNRAFCERMLHAEWDRSVRYGKSLALAVVDIDRFADYNARLGPLAGDDCLRRLARVLEDVPGRSSDLVCRYAGDRFALVLPETDAEGARLLAERLLAAVRAQALVHPGHGADGLVTVTVVVAACRPQRGQQAAAFMGAAVDRLDDPARGDGNTLMTLAAPAA